MFDPGPSSPCWLFKDNEHTMIFCHKWKHHSGNISSFILQTEGPKLSGLTGKKMLMWLIIFSCFSCFESFPVCPTRNHVNSLNHKAIWLLLIYIRMDQSDAIYADVQCSKSDKEPKQHVRVVSQGNTASSRGLRDTDASLRLEGHDLNSQIH